MEQINSLKDIVNSIPQEWSVKEKARKAYLLLGKNSFYNTKFNHLFGYPQYEIFEEGDSYQNPNIGVCKKFSSQYLTILRCLGIRAREIISEIDDFGMYHSNVGFLDEDLLEHVANLALDLPRIQTHSSTTHFADDTISPEDLRKIDLTIGYISPTRGYTDDYFEIIKESLRNHDLSESEKVDLMFATLSRFFDLSELGQDEQAKAIKFFAKNVFDCKNTSLFRPYIKSEGEEHYYIKSFNEAKNGVPPHTTYKVYNKGTKSYENAEYKELEERGLIRSTSKYY